MRKQWGNKREDDCVNFGRGKDRHLPARADALFMVVARRVVLAKPRKVEGGVACRSGVMSIQYGESRYLCMVDESMVTSGKDMEEAGGESIRTRRHGWGDVHRQVREGWRCCPDAPSNLLRPHCVCTRARACVCVGRIQPRDHPPCHQMPSDNTQHHLPPPKTRVLPGCGQGVARVWS